MVRRNVPDWMFDAQLASGLAPSFLSGNGVGRGAAVLATPSPLTSGANARSRTAKAIARRMCFLMVVLCPFIVA